LVSLRSADRSRESFRSDQPLEGAHRGPERPQPHGRTAVDRLHARLGHKLGLVVVDRLDPVSEEDPDGPVCVPPTKGGVVLERGIIAGQRPDTPAQARDQRLRPFLQNGEGIGTKEIAEGLVGRGVGNPPADQAAECPSVREAYRAGCTPHLLCRDAPRPPVVAADRRVRQPPVQVWKTHIYLVRVPV
jgi:hypothetical protein